MRNKGMKMVLKKAAAFILMISMVAGLIPPEAFILKVHAGESESESVSTEYLDENGELKSVEATPLTKNITSLGTAKETSWYVVNSDVTYSQSIHIEGDVRLILADSCQMTISTNNYSIYFVDDSSLTIYSRSIGENMGCLAALGNCVGILRGSTLTVNGGRIEITSDNSGIYLSHSSDAVINNGRVSVTGNNGVFANDDDCSLTINGGEVVISAEGADLKALGDKLKYVHKGGDVILNDYGEVNEYYDYIDADGSVKRHLAAEITNESYPIGHKGEERWYIAKGKLDFNDKTMHFQGKVNLILADDSEMNVSKDDYSISYENTDLTIYSQSRGAHAGKLNTQGQVCIKEGSSLTINGGQIDLKGNGNQAAVWIRSTRMDINGGRINVNGGTEMQPAIEFWYGGTLTLGYNSVSDHIQINGIDKSPGTDDGTVRIMDGQSLRDEEGNSYSGTLDAELRNAIKGKKLTPVAYEISIAENEGGKVKANRYAVDQSEEGVLITLDITPDKGYETGTVSYNDGSDHTIAPVDGVYSFTMPKHDVSVAAEFKRLHDFSYSAEGATIMALCSDDECKLPGKKASLTIAKPVHEVYGDGKPAAALISGDTDILDIPGVIYSRGTEILDSAPVKPGAYTASITLGDATVSVDYTIAKRSVTITGLTAEDKIYDGSAEAVISERYVLIGKLDNDEVSVEGKAAFDSAAAGKDKTVTFSDVSLTGRDADNYELTAAPESCTADISLRPVTVSAEDKVKKEGETDPAFTAVLEGLAEGEEESLIVYSLSREEGEAVGSYAIIPAGDELQGNYTVSYKAGRLTIEKAEEPEKEPETEPEPETDIVEGRSYALNVMSGAIVRDKTGSPVYSAKENEKLSLSWTAVEGYEFVKWSVKGASIDNPVSSNTVIRMGAGDAAVSFELKLKAADEVTETKPETDSSIKVKKLRFGEKNPVLLKNGGSIVNKAVAEGAEDAKIVYVTENSDIAAADQSGRIYPVGVGETTITAYCGTKSAKCKVTVVSYTTQLIIRDENGDFPADGTVEMKSGEQKFLSAFLEPYDSTDPRNVSWKSDSKKLTVKNGMINAKEVSEVTEVKLTATVATTDPANQEKKISRTIKIRLIPAAVPGTSSADKSHTLSLNKKALSMTTGDKKTAEFAVKLSGRGDTDISAAELKVYSSNPEIVSINAVKENGVEGSKRNAAVSLEAQRAGTAYIVVCSRGKDSSEENIRRIKVTVTTPATAIKISDGSLELKDKKLTMRKGQNGTISAVSVPDFSTDSGKLKITGSGGVRVKNGIIYAVKAKNGKITVKCGKLKETIEVTVTK